MKIPSSIGAIETLKGMLPSLLFFVSFSLEAWDLGGFGETFKIEEKDLLEQILSKLRVLKMEGKLEQLSTEANRRVGEMILKPNQVQGINYTEVRREYWFDPSVTVTRDLSDNQGRVFARKGERFNPLDNVSMRPLIFIDGDNEKHVKWAVSKLSDSKIYRHEQGKIVLVKGSPLSLQKILKQDVYFDQFGLLTRKLKIKHVPVIVYQKQNEKVLTILEELP